VQEQKYGCILLKAVDHSQHKIKNNIRRILNIMMTVQEIIDNFSREDGRLHWGINTAMQSLRPGCLYGISAGNGQFEIVDWPENQWSDVTQSYIDPPTPQEIRDEYLRHKTIAECLEYFNTKGESK
jgi:hypothetical protein